MRSEEISLHLSLYKKQQDRAAAEEKARQEKEAAFLRQSCARCESVLRETVWPILLELSEILADHGHKAALHPVQEMEHVTARTHFRKIEYTASLSLERPKGALTLRMAASPHTLTISASIGIPHGNCNSVVVADTGPLDQAVEIARKGIADFMPSAFPLVPGQ